MSSAASTLQTIQSFFSSIRARPTPSPAAAEKAAEQETMSQIRKDLTEDFNLIVAYQAHYIAFRDQSNLRKEWSAAIRQLFQTVFARLAGYLQKQKDKNASARVRSAATLFYDTIVPLMESYLLAQVNDPTSAQAKYLVVNVGSIQKAIGKVVGLPADHPPPPPSFPVVAKFSSEFCATLKHTRDATLAGRLKGLVSTTATNAECQKNIVQVWNNYLFQLLGLSTTQYARPAGWFLFDVQSQIEYWKKAIVPPLVCSLLFVIKEYAQTGCGNQLTGGTARPRKHVTKRRHNVKASSRLFRAPPHSFQPQHKSKTGGKALAEGDCPESNFDKVVLHSDTVLTPVELGFGSRRLLTIIENKQVRPTYKRLQKLSHFLRVFVTKDRDASDPKLVTVRYEFQAWKRTGFTSSQHVASLTVDEINNYNVADGPARTYRCSPIHFHRSQ